MSSEDRSGEVDESRQIVSLPVSRDNLDAPAATTNEVEFALVLARMIESVKHDPEQLRGAIYELARHKLEEQFTHADPSEVQQTKNALEVAIRGVEMFFKKDEPGSGLLRQALPSSTISADDKGSSKLATHSPAMGPASNYQSEQASTSPSSEIRKTFTPLRLVSMVAVLLGSWIAIQQRATLTSWLHSVRVYDPSAITVTIPQSSIDSSQSQSAMQKSSSLLPTTYGIYAISDGKLFELKLLSLRAPDMRIAISAAIEGPSQTSLPNGDVKFVVFRRESGSSNADRAEVRLIAKVTRAISYDGQGKPNSSGEDRWVIRNISFPYRMAPIKDNPEMDEIESESPGTVLSPGRYALVLKNQAYDFSVAGQMTDPRHCLERLTASNGTFYSQCSLRPSIR